MTAGKHAQKAVRAAAKPPRPTIGWREWVHLPGLLDQPIKAKIDTGARTSAIHAFHIREFIADGVRRVEFRLHPLQRRKTPEVRCVADIHDERVITSSNGQRDRRFVILVDVAVGATRWPIELTLADRDQMGFRMLLGREALRRRFLVDPGRSYRQSERRPGSVARNPAPARTTPNTPRFA
ncbi:ATP-dependent zinc protease family protein [Luteimonas vadosa]|uniref:Retropepsin-like aspartic endopeptidase domain-containing protein n=1 Tax=Luteimonas vadosa TaxID=1165507 RepID=A0ABP9DYA1_9GAMM